MAKRLTSQERRFFLDRGWSNADIDLLVEDRGLDEAKRIASGTVPVPSQLPTQVSGRLGPALQGARDEQTGGRTRRSDPAPKTPPKRGSAVPTASNEKRASAKVPPGLTAEERRFLRSQGMTDADINTAIEQAGGGPRGVEAVRQQVRAMQAGPRAGFLGLSADEADIEILRRRGTPGRRLDSLPRSETRGLDDRQRERTFITKPTPEVKETFFDILREPYDMSKQEVADLQKRLVSAGLLTAGDFIEGVYDPSTISAYRLSLEEAFLRDKTPDEVIAERAARGAGEQAKKKFVPPTRKPFAEQQIELGIKQAFQEHYGRFPTDSEFRKFQSMFRNLEQRFFEDQESAALQRFEANQFQDTTEVSGGEGVAVGRLPSPGQLTEAELIDSEEGRIFHGARLGLHLLDQLRAGAL